MSGPSYSQDLLNFSDLVRVLEGDEKLVAFELIVDDDAFPLPPLDIPEVDAFFVLFGCEVPVAFFPAAVHGDIPLEADGGSLVAAFFFWKGLLFFGAKLVGPGLLRRLLKFLGGG